MGSVCKQIAVRYYQILPDFFALSKSVLLHKQNPQNVDKTCFGICLFFRSARDGEG
jgi:hypothetical protein